MSLFTRDECLRRLRAQVAAKKPILGGGAGTGISAKCAEAGGIDLLILYNSGKYRMAGRGSLAGMMPYGDANAIVMDMAREVLPVARKTPVLAGVCGTDPFRIMELFLRDVIAAGFSGVQNFPTVGLIDGTFRQGVEETGMGYGLEVDMIATAHRMGLLTCPYVFNPDEAVAMTRVGADVLIPHMGLTTKGSIGAQTALSLEESARRVQAMADAAKLSDPTCSSSVTAARSANPRTPATSSRTAPASSASSVRQASSGCRPRSRSLTAFADSRGWA